MMKALITLLTILSFLEAVTAQIVGLEAIKHASINLGDVSDEAGEVGDFSALKTILKEVEIVMLGEQSHGDGTTYSTKIKLIKYLHEELGFDFLVFESGFYECYKAGQLISQGEDVRMAMGKSIFGLWSTTKDFIPLVEYIATTRNTKNPLKLLGFDSQFNDRIDEREFINDLSAFLKTVNPAITDTKAWQHFSQNISHLLKYEFKSIKKNQPEADTAFIHYLIQEISKVRETPLAGFWLQTLKSTKVFLADVVLKTDDRDRQMADNLAWIKEQYPNSKIICWGATSHFLYNSKSIRMKNPIVQALGGRYYKKQPMMGHYVKEKYGKKVFTIGFTTFQGEYGLWKSKKISPPKKGTVENLLGQSEYDNFLLPLKDFNFEGYDSRPLGNSYMKTPINEVMDAVIFNRNMRGSVVDRDFFLKIYPGHKYIKPAAAE